ncbi:MAG: endolytic transglycosylase MltG [Gammaproteobacteria bacterium]|nr:MAG: endolytic transglycosylase MltG [Gammaproteobacteria bacterium]
MKKILYKIIAFFILTISITCGWLWMDFNNFIDRQANLPDAGIDITVNEGATFASVSRELYEMDIIDSLFYAKLSGKVFPHFTKIKKGEYHLVQTMSARDIFLKLASGKVKIYQIRFIEGWTFKQFLAQLADEKNLRQDIVNFKKQQIAEKLSIEQNNPEGWFYPDTYNFQKGTSDLEILQSSHNMMQKILSKHWDERDIGLPYETAYEVLIMASIIEKETGSAGERSRIAGVFIRRLNKNMRLQTDPTVIYGLGDAFDGDIKRKDLNSQSVYNTYRHKGLPPTPIAMPSEASISAAVHPAEGTELYFVARGDGSHQFSSTLEEHNQAVRKYQLNQ